MALALLLGLLGSAHADEIDAWIELYDGILTEAADNDVDAAVRTYQGLSRTLPAGEPVRGVALYWLGRALDSDDDTTGARYALRECVRAGNARERCLDLLGRIELEAASVRRVPTEWSMADGQHGFIHPWVYAQKGGIRPGDGDARHPEVLVWSTSVSPDRDDQLLMGVSSPIPAPSSVRLDVRPTRNDWVLRIVVFDVLGNRWLPAGRDAVQVAETGRWTSMDFSLETLRPLEGDERLDPRNIDHIVFQDISAFQGAPSGPNELWIGRVRVY